MSRRRPSASDRERPGRSGRRFRPDLQRLEDRLALSHGLTICHVAEYGSYGGASDFGDLGGSYDYGDFGGASDFGSFGESYDYGDYSGPGGVTDYADSAPGESVSWPGNGCGPEGILGALIPDAPLGFDFTEACNGHDRCYDVGNDTGTCNVQFLGDAMLEVCDGNLICNGVAYVYYVAVEAVNPGGAPVVAPDMSYWGGN